MTATNHALTGTIIGLAVGNPLLAVPSALLSHFVCDALPHFALPLGRKYQSWFKRLLLAEATVCLLIVLLLMAARPLNWQLAAICAFVAASPDFMWIPKFRRSLTGEPEPSRQPKLLRFHAWIQWYERPTGVALEIMWAATIIILLKVYYI